MDKEHKKMNYQTMVMDLNNKILENRYILWLPCTPWPFLK